MDAIAANEKSLASLKTKLHKISGSAAKLSIPVPVVSSGGGGGGVVYSSGGGGGVRTIIVTRTVTSGAPAATHACTTASGKPC